MESLAAIGVVYRPDTELASPPLHERLPHQFDALVWFEEARAVTLRRPRG